MQNNKKPKILIGIACLTPMYPFFVAFIEFFTDIVKSGRYEVALDTSYRLPTFCAQEQFAENAVEANCDFLLLLDDDIYNPSLEFLDRLISDDKDVTGGVFFSSADPSNLCAKRLVNPKDDISTLSEKGSGELFSMYSLLPSQMTQTQGVDLISLGFILIKTSVFKGLSKPWFSNRETMRYSDSAFCENCRRNGVKVHANFGVFLNHRGITRFNQEAWVDVKKHEGPIDVRPRIPMTDKEMKRHMRFIKQRVSEGLRRYEKAKVDSLKFY